MKSVPMITTKEGTKKFYMCQACGVRAQTNLRVKIKTESYVYQILDDATYGYNVSVGTYAPVDYVGVYEDMISVIVRCPDCGSHMVELDRGIMDVIEVLWRNDIETDMSCEGHLDSHYGIADDIVQSTRRISSDIVDGSQVARIDDVTKGGIELYRGPWIDFRYESIRNPGVTMDEMVQAMTALVESKVSPNMAFYVSVRNCDEGPNNSYKLFRVMVGPKDYRGMSSNMSKVVFCDHAINNPGNICLWNSYHRAALNILFYFASEIARISNEEDED